MAVSLIYRPEIDGLRALAVLPVILFHAGFAEFGGGFVGVDVFFVISGYLIASIIIQELDADRFSLAGFYERRARRILPALFFVTAMTTVFAWLWFVPRDMRNFSASLFAVATFSSNILFARKTGYFDTAIELQPMLHTWSLAIEEQYYIVFPIFFVLFWRLGRPVVIGVLSIGSAISFCLIYAASLGNSYAFYLLPTRAWELGVGALGALYLNQFGFRPAPRVVGQGLAVIGIGLIVVAVTFFDETTPFPGASTLVPVGGALLIILFGEADTIVGRFLGSRLLVGVGLISYSAYLWHFPIIALSEYREISQHSRFYMGMLCVFSLIPAWFSWRYVEKPFRQKNFLTRKLVFIFSVAGLCLIASLGALGTLKGGFPDRFSDKQRKAIETAKYSPMRDKCHSSDTKFAKAEESCKYFVADPGWAVLGDSHAVELGYAFANHLRARHDGIYHFSFSNCAPAYPTKQSSHPCPRWTEEVLKFLAETPSVKNVVLSYRTTTAFSQDHRGLYPKVPQQLSASVQTRRWNSLIAIMNELIVQGKTVYYILQAPESPIDVQRMIQFVPNGENSDIGGVTLRWWMQRNSFVTSRLDELPNAVVVIDPAKLFCDEKICHVIENGTSFYFDDNHISIAGADRIAAFVLSEHWRSANKKLARED